MKQQVQRSRARHLRLLAVLMLPVALLLFDRLLTLGLLIHYREVWPPGWFGWATRIGLYTGGFALGGVLVDRFGVRKVVSLTMLVWCASALLSATADDAVLALSPVVSLALLPGVIHMGTVVAIKRIWPMRRATVALAVVIQAGFLVRRPDYSIYLDLFATVGGGWRAQLMLLTTCGAVATALWLLAPRAAYTRLPSTPSADEPLPDIIRTAIALLGRREIRILILLLWCNDVLYYLVELRVFRSLFNRHLVDGTAGLRAWAPYIVSALAFLGAAAWSGRILARTRSVAAARRPFIGGGFLLVALAGFIPLVSAFGGDDIAMASVVGIGLGLTATAEILIVDLAPDELAGGAIGIALTVSSFLAIMAIDVIDVAFHPIDHPDVTAVAASMVALAAAAAAFRLLRGIEPLNQRDTLRERLEVTFE